MLGVFTMNAKNTPAIKDVLKKYKLKYIPEAHNYFRAYNYILAYTGIGINVSALSTTYLIAQSFVYSSADIGLWCPCGL